MAAIPEEITGLLLQWKQGDKDALDRLIQLVYPELRRLARQYMRREGPEHTLQTSALINEAYLRLVGQQQTEWNNRSHFYAVASQVMRHILVDHARRYQFTKHGAGAEHVPLDEAGVVSQKRASEFVALDDALTRLAVIDARKSQIVEMKFFSGLTVNEIAEVLELSPITIKREWRLARAWLHLEISPGGTN